MKRNAIRPFSILTVLAVVMSVMPQAVFAQGAGANGLGRVLNNVAKTNDFTLILSVGSYVIGCMLAVVGLLKLKGWVDEKVNFSNGIWHIVGGALMICLPDFMNKTINSLFGSWNNAGSTSANYNNIKGLTGNYNANGGVVGLDQAIVNFVVDIYQPAKYLTGWGAMIVGVTCMITGIYRLAQAGQAAGGRAPSPKGTMAYIFGGALLLSASQLMDAVSTSLFGTAATGQFSSLYYAVPGMDETAVNHVYMALFAFVEIIGWVAFVRGIFLLVKIAQSGGDKTHAHAFTHIIFGAAAVNMYTVVKVVQTSLGVQLVN